MPAQVHSSQNRGPNSRMPVFLTSRISNSKDESWKNKKRFLFQVLATSSLETGKVKERIYLSTEYILGGRSKGSAYQYSKILTSANDLSVSNFLQPNH